MVFVVAAGEKGKGMIRSALKRLQVARLTPIGAVLTKFNPKTVGYTYGYGYGYGSGYGYGYPEFSYSQRNIQGAEDRPPKQISADTEPL